MFFATFMPMLRETLIFYATPVMLYALAYRYRIAGGIFAVAFPWIDLVHLVARHLHH